MHILICTTIFPANMKFFIEFLGSLKKQTFKEFSLLLVNDGADTVYIEQLMKDSGLHYVLDNYSSTISKNREHLIKTAKEMDYDSLLFSDTDDCLSSTLVEDSIRCLEDYPIVFHDLEITDSKGQLIKNNLWADRFKENKTIGKDFIRHKNVLGLGNTAVNEAVLTIPAIPEDIGIVDWFVFQRIIGDNIAVFNESSTVKYRQHEANIIGKANIGYDEILKKLNLLERYFFHSIEFDASYNFEWNCIKNYQLSLSSKTGILDDNWSVVDQSSTSFWWEEFEHIYKKE